ncbi:MAG: DUF3795 domain-containing protein, partial [Candidatus Bathyarchaeota archaeon]|nr:DUF3795 domain-containing protein [Candidatus Bathyarchaeota archaeon]
VLGYTPIKTACATCQTPDDKIPKTSKLPSKKCLIRQCVDKTGIDNCAYCSRFPCGTLKDTAGLWNRKSIETRLGQQISEDQYHKFVEPFEGLTRLEGIRSSLKSDQIVEPAKATESKMKTVEFPKNLQQDVASFKAVHKLLTNIQNSDFGLKDSDTFAQMHKLEKQKMHVLRFLWILASHGKLEKENTTLVIDAQTYMNNRGQEKNLAMRTFVENVVFKNLSQFGVDSELVPLNDAKNEQITTGTGYLRKNGWLLKIWFMKKTGGADLLKALQNYAKKLDKKYGSKAFRVFQQADMTVLSK